jgi:threonine/homoserine/homoserine lactone efflux protein
VEGLLAFILAGFALAGSPGPGTLSLAATGAAFGARRGVAYMTGINFGMVGVMTVTATGVVGVVLAVPGAVPVVTVLAGAYFLYLAFRIATAPPLTEHDEQRRPPSFGAGVFLSAVNPKGYAAMAALFSGFMLVRDRLVLDAAVKIAVLAVIITSVNLA